MANLICAKCGQPIEQENLVECPFCWEIYHKECWEETPNCLSCNKFNLDYAQVQAEKEAEAERLELEEKNKAEDEQPEETQETEENPFEAPTSEMNHSAVANNVMSMSMVVLIIGAVAGVALVVGGFFLRGIKGAIAGLVAGAVAVALGWVASVLINGFAELINNSQKNAYYLSKLLSKKEDEEKDFDD